MVDSAWAIRLAGSSQYHEKRQREDRTYGGLNLAMALPKEIYLYTHITPEAMLQTQP